MKDAPIHQRYRDDELLIFLGYSDDAKEEASAVKELEGRIQQELKELNRLGREAPLIRFRTPGFFDWQVDAPRFAGGQRKLIQPALERADIAVFVFRNRVGEVTWQELDEVRNRRKKPIPMIAAFPEKPPAPEILTDVERTEEWLDLLRKRKSLTTDWTEDESTAVASVGYQNLRELGDVVFGEIRKFLRSSAASAGTHRRNRKISSGAEIDRESLADYLRMVAEDCRDLPLRGLDIRASDATAAQTPMELQDVYVALNTTTQVDEPDNEETDSKQQVLRREAEDKRLSVLGAVVNNRRVVILGDPGSGKSTVLSYLALCLASHQCEPNEGWLKRLPGWPEDETDLVPVRLVLRDFARWLPLQERDPAPRDLGDFIAATLDLQDMAAATKSLRRCLDEGKAIVFLDGMDEVPTDRLREAVCDAVNAFSERHSRCRIVVTCRTLSYQDENRRLAGFPWFRLAPLDEGQIQAFIEAWHGELERIGTDTREKLSDLCTRLKDAVQRPDLRRLAPNPLLLTVMSLLHTHIETLPRARVPLYEEIVNLLLWRWEKKKGRRMREEPEVLRLLGEARVAEMALKRAIW